MSQRPAFLVDFNAEAACAYHSEPYTNDRAELIETTDTRTVWHLVGHNATVTEARTAYPGISAVRMETSVRNDGDVPLTLDTLSSLYIDGIGAEGTRWFDDRFVLHYTHMVWQGEAQWRHATLEDLGLYPTYNHGNQRTITFSGAGSWSTSRYYPIILLEDTVTGETHSFEIHSSGSWYIEVGARGYQENSSIYVLLSAAHEKNDGWFVTLAPGESYTASPAVYSCVKGGFEAAVAELTAYKRATALTSFPMGTPPVCFNDYMNCLWAQPTRARLEPLIKAASEAGCEVFCIDAGWFGAPGEWSMHNGDWQEQDELFGKGGLAGMLADITAAGMHPGVWLEMETVDSRSNFAKAHPEALLTRHGHPIGLYQCFMDFRLPVVRDHLMGVINHLYDMGVRFIKNDYNHTTGIYIDAKEGQSGAHAHAEHVKAYLAFIDEAIATHPGLMIENCNSGANRCDHGTLAHFHIQSTSDQEFYDRYPSIIQGMCALMPPERAGIWAYPYPVAFHLREEQAEIYPVVSEPVKAMIEESRTGDQTAFNMVNGMMGAMYLSGRICYADEKNAALIRDAIAIYKENRTVLSGAVPIYPQGLLRLSQRGHTSFGLLNRAAGKLLLAVWQINTDATETLVDLTAYVTDSATVARTYPHLDGYACSLNEGIMSVNFPAGNCAAYLEIDL